MTPTPLSAETPRAARRVARLLSHSSLAVLIATGVCVADDAPVALILALPLVALICLAVAMGSVHRHGTRWWVRRPTKPRTVDCGSSSSTQPRFQDLTSVRPAAAHTEAMRLLVIDHPLVAHKVTALRDIRTDSPTFRRLVDELVTLLAYEATRDVRTETVEVTTPVADDHRGPAGPTGAARRAGSAGRPGDARRHGPAAAQRRGRLPGHGAQRGHPAAVDVRVADAGRPQRPRGVRPRPDARHRRDPGRDGRADARARARPRSPASRCCRPRRASPPCARPSATSRSR